MGYIVVALSLAAGVLYSMGVLLSPAIGAVLMSVSTVIGAINTNLLKVKKAVMSSLDQKSHWEKIYDRRSETDLSWFQLYPETSLKFIQFFDLPFTANIIDVGGGDSHMVDALLDAGFQNVWVLDISRTAIGKAKARLGERASKVNWVISDIVDFVPPLKFDLWHDRAAFHFLTNDEKIHKYVSIAENAITRGGYLILSTFSEDGPKKCSGLEIKQYSEASMSERFEAAFERVKCTKEVHITPFNTAQHFVFCSFRKK